MRPLWGQTASDDPACSSSSAASREAPVPGRGQPRRDLLALAQRALSRALARPLTVETAPREAARATMLARIPERYVDMLLGQWEEETHRPATVTGEVERITGVPATPYDDALAWVLGRREV